jgi:CRISPR/Cas system CSM-associated protein Csm3 (group 7 of RAMP superfamily)
MGLDQVIILSLGSRGSWGSGSRGYGTGRLIIAPVIAIKNYNSLSIIISRWQGAG